MYARAILILGNLYVSAGNGVGPYGGGVTSASENLALHSRVSAAEEHDLSQLEDFVHADIESTCQRATSWWV